MKCRDTFSTGDQKGIVTESLSTVEPEHILTALKHAPPQHIDRVAHSMEKTAHKLRVRAAQIRAETDHRRKFRESLDLAAETADKAIAQIMQGHDKHAVITALADHTGLPYSQLQAHLVHAKRRFKAMEIDNRRRRVVRLAAIGMTNKEIGEQLGCSPSTVSKDLNAVRSSASSVASAPWPSPRGRR